MTKKIIGGITVLVIAFVVAFNMNVGMEQKDGKSSLALANVEALAFEFNGQDWDKDEHWYNGLGGKWSPVVKDCTYTTNTGGGINIGPVGISMGGSSTSWNGKMVVCSNGNGNCVNGTDCTP